MADKQFTTIQGDTWDGIAKKMLGSEYFMTELIDANPQHQDIVIFSANIVLNIPDIDTTQIQDPMSLPPWKRGVSS